jgi:hypothetical protein
MKLHSIVCDVCRLTPGDRGAMFHLMERSFANMRPDRFEADLGAKQWVILVRAPDDNRLVGFSTQVMLQARVDGRRVRALYSGDTVVDRDYWGDPALAQAWGRFALERIEAHPCGPLYWFLTSKGFRTYRYLPLFFHLYFPRPQQPTPPWERAVIDAFGQVVGHECYDSTRNIIRAAAGKDYVRREIAHPGQRRRTDPHIRFFVERNPGFIRGDELCCLAPLTPENFTPAAYRVIGPRSETLNAV